MKTNPKELKYVFFGTGEIAVFVLKELLQAGFVPSFIVTGIDTQKGRGLEMSSSPVALLALEHSIATLKVNKIDDTALTALQESNAELFVIADFGALLRKNVLDIPPKGTLNVHPSLLPRLRGPSPIRSAILTSERDTGVTIMVLDVEMDHGPIIAQKKISIDPWPPNAAELEETLATAGGKLLAEILPLWITGEIDAHAQNHDIATYCKKFEKSDGEIDLSDDAISNLLKIRAFEGWPTAYTFFDRCDKSIRTQILDAHIENGVLVIDTVKPEGKGAMPYSVFIQSGAVPRKKTIQ